MGEDVFSVLYSLCFALFYLAMTMGTGAEVAFKIWEVCFFMI